MAAWAAALIGSGTSKVRLADAEVDRVFETAGQLEDLADARHLDGPHAVGDPAVGVEGVSHDACSQGENKAVAHNPEAFMLAAAPVIAKSRQFQAQKRSFQNWK